MKFIILGAIVALIIDAVIARKFSEIAEMKGHDGSSYFRFTLLFGIIGMLMVFALPTIYEAQYNYDNTPSVTAQSAPKTQPLTQPQVQAPNTKDVNRGAAPVSAEISNGEKVCPKCGQSQKIDRRVCWSCGQPFDN